MNNKSSNQEENKPLDPANRGESVQRSDKPPLDDIVSSLRSDIPSEVEAVPEKKQDLRSFDFRLVLGAFLSVVIIGLVWIVLIIRGRNFIDYRLASLTQRAATSTGTLTPLSPSATRTLIVPTSTSAPTFTSTVTSKPTKTPVVVIPATPIPKTATLTITATPRCRDALRITLADVGKTVCVQGVVIGTVTEPSYFMVVFSDEKGAFYWVTYDFVWSDAKLNTCYETTGTIEQIGTTPMLVFGYKNIPEVCH